MIGFVKTSLQSIKNICQLDSCKKSLVICFDLLAVLRVLRVQRNRSDVLVLLRQKCQIFKVFYLWLKKFDTRINAILVISELMASARKVLRHFCCHREKFRTGVACGSVAAWHFAWSIDCCLTNQNVKYWPNSNWSLLQYRIGFFCYKKQKQSVTLPW